jgi:hypothetical protein
LRIKAQESIDSIRKMLYWMLKSNQAATITPWAALRVARSMVEKSFGIGLILYWDSGEGVERADFYESRALNANILLQGTGFFVPNTESVSQCP